VRTVWIKGLDGYLHLIAAEWVEGKRIKDEFSISKEKTQELYDTLSDDFSDTETQPNVAGCIRRFDTYLNHIHEDGFSERLTFHQMSTILERMAGQNVQ